MLWAIWTKLTSLLHHYYDHQSIILSLFIGLQRSNQTSHIQTQHIEQQQQQQQINQTLNTARTNTTVNSPAEIQLEENPSSIYKNEQSNSNEVDPDQTQIHTDYLSVEVQRGLSDDVDESIKDDSESSEEIPATTEPCPVNFLRHKDSCYHITKPSQMTWGVADTYCKMYDSKLVEIDSKSEQNFIESLIKLTKDNLINAALGKNQYHKYPRIGNYLQEEKVGFSCRLEIVKFKTS